MDWQPQIDHTRCTGCGTCVAQCPTQALSLIEQRAVVSAPHRCTYCEACETLCPTQAIQLPYQIIFVTDISTHHTQ